MFSSARALLCILALATLAVTHRAGAQTPTPTDIGNLGGGSAGVNAVATGFVVGSSRTGTAVDQWGNQVGHAFVWSASTQTMLDIGALLPDSGLSIATGVNSHGEVVGGAYSPDYSSVTGFYWSPATGIRTICAVGNIASSPLLINDNGVVAGSDANGHVFRWTLAGGLQDFGSVPGGGGTYDTFVSGINAAGDFVGNSGATGSGYAVGFVAYASANTLTILTSPGLSSPPPISIQNEVGVNIQVNGINDNGVVVGTYWDYQYMYGGYDISQGGFFQADVHNSHAFKWSSSGGFTDLGNLGTWPLIGPPYPTYSGFAASANAINNSGMIVGYSYLATGGYAPFVYNPATGITQLPSLYPGDTQAQATGINDDGVVVGYANGTSAAVLWKDGVLANLTPSFAPYWPGAPFIKGSTIAGNGLDGNWNGHAWTLALPSSPPPPTQTLTILGGSGNVGDVAANVEYYNPATGNWQPAYLADYAPYGHPFTHPWGNIADTDHWINYKRDGASDPGASENNPLWYLYRVRFTVPTDAQNATMTFSLKADNMAQVAINGVSTGPMIVGQADQLNADAVFSQNVHPGENTITINVGDQGGLNGFNFRIDLSVESSQPLEIVPVAPSDTTPPVISPVANITAEATSAAGAVATFAATATDAVGVTSFTSSAASGSTFPIGTTTVNLTAKDAAGNSASGSFTITVSDTTPPALTVPANQVLEATSAAGAVASFSATATDAVGVTSLTYSAASGSTFPLGTSTVTVTATDAAGNSSSGSFTVTVRDTTPPALTVPANQVLEATSAAGAVASFSATATDAVGVTSLTSSEASGSTFPIGTSTVTVTAKDAAGNTSSGSFTVTVRDTTAPVISSLTASSTTLWPPDHKMVPITLTSVVSDAVGVTSLKILSATSNEPDNGLGDGDTAGDIEITGALTLNLRAERSGAGNGRVYTITVEAKDAAGNATTRTVTVSVPKSQGGK